MGILDWLVERKMRKDLEKFISPEVLEMIEKDPWQYIKEVELKHFQYVIVHIDESKPDEQPAWINSVLRTISSSRANFPELDSTLITCSFGQPFQEDDRSELRLELVAQLLKRNGRYVRVAHGKCNGWHGNFGNWSPKREERSALIWGGIIPGYSAILRRLFETPFGEAFEVEP